MITYADTYADTGIDADTEDEEKEKEKEKEKLLKRLNFLFIFIFSISVLSFFFSFLSFLLSSSSHHSSSHPMSAHLIQCQLSSAQPIPLHSTSFIHSYISTNPLPFKRPIKTPRYQNRLIRTYTHTHTRPFRPFSPFTCSVKQKQKHVILPF